MGSPELRGIYIDIQESPLVSNQGIREALSSSGISSATSVCNDINPGSIPRKRYVSPDMGDLCSSQLDEYEMEKLRRIMTHVDGDRRGSGTSIASSYRGSIEPSLMSTVFAVVLVIVISISVYAFTSLYRAVMKRLNDS